MLACIVGVVSVDRNRTGHGRDRIRRPWYPPSGVVGIAGIQQLWIGKNHAGKIATLWMDLTSVHVIVDEAVVKTVLSRPTTIDLERLQMRGARPERSAPAVAAVDVITTDERLGAIEIDRRGDRNGIVRGSER